MNPRRENKLIDLVLKEHRLRNTTVLKTWCTLTCQRRFKGANVYSANSIKSTIAYIGTSSALLARHTGETIKSANCLEQTCSKKIWRRGGGARIAEQQADLHGIIRSHRTSVHIRR